MATDLAERWAERSWNIWTGPDGDRAEIVAYVCRRLCIGPERSSEVDSLLGPGADLGASHREVVTAWWPGEARSHN